MQPQKQSGTQRPTWDTKPETLLVKRNYEECLRGSHEPRPLVPPIIASSAYILENAKEGETLASTNAAVSGFIPLV